MKSPVFGSCMAFLLLCFAATAWTAEDVVNGVLNSSDGEQVYTQLCQGCHLSGGRGAIGAGY